jgi:hypothetical protein
MNIIILERNQNYRPAAADGPNAYREAALAP